MRAAGDNRYGSGATNRAPARGNTDETNSARAKHPGHMLCASVAAGQPTCRRTANSCQSGVSIVSAPRTRIAQARSRGSRTSDCALRERLEAWREIYGRTLLKLDIEPIEDAFHTDVRMRKVPGLGMITGSRSATFYRRNRIDNDDLVMSFGLGGGFEAMQFGRTEPCAGRSGRGDGGRAGSCPRVVRRQDDHTVPAAVRTAHAVSALDAAPVPADSRRQCGIAAADALFGILDETDMLATDAQRHAVAHVHDLVALTLGATRDGAEPPRHAAPARRGCASSRTTSARTSRTTSRSHHRGAPSPAGALRSAPVRGRRRDVHRIRARGASRAVCTACCATRGSPCEDRYGRVRRRLRRPFVFQPRVPPPLSAPRRPTFAGRRSGGIGPAHAAFFCSAIATSVRRIRLVPLSRCSGLLPVVEEHDPHVGAHLRGRPLLADVGDKPFRIGEHVVAERQHRALRPGVDLLDIGAPAQRLDGDDLEQVLHFLRQRAEAVDQLRRETSISRSSSMSASLR